MASKPKVTDEQFIEAYVAANGSYAGTAQYIQQNYDVAFSRTAAMKRAKKFPNLKRDMLELMENDFDDHLTKFAHDEGNDIRLRARIYLQLKIQLNRLNHKTQKTYTPEHEGGYDYFDINGNIITFDDENDKEAIERIKQGLPGPGYEAWQKEYSKKTELDGLPD